MASGDYGRRRAGVSVLEAVGALGVEDDGAVLRDVGVRVRGVDVSAPAVRVLARRALVEVVVDVQVRGVRVRRPVVRVLAQHGLVQVLVRRVDVRRPVVGVDARRGVVDVVVDVRRAVVRVRAEHGFVCVVVRVLVFGDEVDVRGAVVVGLAGFRELRHRLLEGDGAGTERDEKAYRGSFCASLSIRSSPAGCFFAHHSQ